LTDPLAFLEKLRSWREGDPEEQVKEWEALQQSLGRDLHPPCDYQIHTGRFYLFFGDSYYPLGGLRDYKGVFRTYEAAFSSIPKLFGDQKERSVDWWQIVVATPNGLELAEPPDE
jgi:hypothetical protein